MATLSSKRMVMRTSNLLVSGVSPARHSRALRGDRRLVAQISKFPFEPPEIGWGPPTGESATGNCSFCLQENGGRGPPSQSTIAPDVAVRGCDAHLKYGIRASPARQRCHLHYWNLGHIGVGATDVLLVHAESVRPVCRWRTKIFSSLIPKDFSPARWRTTVRKEGHRQ